MRHATILMAAVILPCGPALAQPDKPLANREPDAVDVAKTPVTDLNLDRQEIPAILIAAQERPYDLTGLKRCPALGSQVAALDEVLGPDLDLPADGHPRVSAGRVAKAVVGSFIPFRGVIREVSGASGHERKVQTALLAGNVRRGFLKGVGQTRRCAWPARPATPDVIAAYQASSEEAEAAGPAGAGAATETARNPD